MNKKSFILLSALAVLGLTACEKGIDDLGEGMSPSPTGQVANSVLQVRTRGTSPSEEATISYPVQVYVMQGDVCQAVQTIGDEGQTLNIPLTEGTYTVYAVSGASATDYDLPTLDDATSTSAIVLKEGKALGDLMAAQATATLVDGGTNTVTLGLQRKTMLMQDITIKQVPTAATAVSVTIAPLWQNITVGGSYSGASGSRTIALTKQDDNRTWQLNSLIGEGTSESLHLLPPSSQPASISVNFTIGGATKTYTYACSDQLEAGYKINIDGTYTEAVGVNLTGTITGATWLGERTITFEFDESSNTSASSKSSGKSGDDDSGELPSAGDTYKGCYVLASTTASDGLSAELTLLSPTELTNVYDADAETMQGKIDAALATVTTGDISGWEVPTTAEAQLMYDAREAIGNLTASNYLCHGGTGYRAFKPTDAVFTSSPSTIKASTVLRPVATVTINKE